MINRFIFTPFLQVGQKWTPFYFLFCFLRDGLVSALMFCRANPLESQHRLFALKDFWELLINWHNNCLKIVYELQKKVQGVIFMPFFDGTGSFGKGQGRRPQGGRMGGKGLGLGGNCVCPNCGTTVPHQRQVPCTSVNCPKCGSRLVRQ